MNEMRKIIETLEGIEREDSSPIHAKVVDRIDGDPVDFDLDDEIDNDVDELHITLDIFYGDKKIGNLTPNQFLGQISGDIGPRYVNLEMDRGIPEDDAPDKEWEEYVANRVARYFSTPTGRKHFEVLSRQLGL